MLDETGLQTMGYQQLVDQLKTKAKQLFGEQVGVEDNNVLGIFIKDIAWLQAIVNQDISDVYYANYIDQADGISLDHLGKNYSVARNPASAAEVELAFTGTPGFLLDSDQELIYATDSGNEYQLIEDVTLDKDGNGTGRAVCTEDGPEGNTSPNTITNQITVLADITSVTNPMAAGGGADVETDTSYRQRIHLSMDAQPGPTYYGLYTALYALPGVEQVQIVFNNSMEVDDAGNPPLSLHFYVLGGNAQDIGQAILDNIAAGIETHGSLKVVAKDIGGHTHDVFFDTAQTVPIYVNMQLITSADFDPIGGPESIRTAIKDYLNTLIMGDKVVFTKLYQAIYNVIGVEYATVSMGRNQDQLGTTDIQLDKFESAIIANDNDVVVTTNE